MDKYEKQLVSSKFAQADLDFHILIAKGSKNPVMYKTIEMLYSIFFNYQYESNKQIGPKSGVLEHKSILNAISLKDEEMASLLMRRHIQRSKKDIEDFYKNGDNNILNH